MSPSDPVSGHPLNFAPALPFFCCLTVGRSAPLFCLVVKGPAADATDALQPGGLLWKPYDEVDDYYFLSFS
jgi:hypothetical protein